jgi:hypothetical protein
MTKRVISPAIRVIDGAAGMREHSVPTSLVVGVAREGGKLLFPALSVIDVAGKSRHSVFPAFLITYLAVNGVSQLSFPALNIAETAFVAEIGEGAHQSDNSKER